MYRRLCLFIIHLSADMDWKYWKRHNHGHCFSVMLAGLLPSMDSLSSPSWDVSKTPELSLTTGMRAVIKVCHQYFIILEDPAIGVRVWYRGNAKFPMDDDETAVYLFRKTSVNKYSELRGVRVSRQNFGKISTLNHGGLNGPGCYG